MVEVVPVLDVMNGVVVHAVAGKRDEYRPLQNSVIACSPRPEDVLAGLKKLGCSTVYIADIDAIEGRGSNRFVIDLALSMGYKVLADIGRDGLQEKDQERLRYVVGTEYVVYPHELSLLRDRVVSLDMKEGRVVFRNSALDVVTAAREVCSNGVSMIIVLSLDRVGTARGLDIDAVKVVKDVCRVPIAVGGGLRDIAEIAMLKNLGIDFVFVASAIHRGIITKCVY